MTTSQFNKPMAAVLFVDHHISALDDFIELFTAQLEVLTAQNFDTAWQLIQQPRSPNIAAIIATESITDPSGQHLFNKVKTHDAKIVCILSTQFVDSHPTIQKFMQQVNVFNTLTKPWDSEDVYQNILTAIQHYKRALFNQQLESVTQDLIKANKFKDQILFNLGHEFQTPLSCIIHASQVLLDENISNEKRIEYSKIIGTSSQLLQNIVADVFDFSRMEASHFQLMSIDFDLMQILDEVQQMHQYLLEEKKITYSHMLTESMPKQLHGDPTRLKQILINLINNAIKFTQPQGEIKVQVSQSNVIDNHIHLTRFDVIDTGIGIAQEELEWLFKPFFHTNSSDKRVNCGTGLGLSISQQIVQYMGGKLQVDSVTGQGSRFWFEIPFKVGTETDDNFTPKVTSSNRDNKFQFHRPIHILLVENDYIHQKLLLNDFKYSNCTIHCVEKGTEVLPEMGHHQFDIILMDCLIPGLSGIEVAQRIRQFEQESRTAKIPIIALTAYPLNYKQTCIDAGMDDFIMKPYKPEKLYRAIEYWLTQ